MSFTKQLKSYPLEQIYTSPQRKDARKGWGWILSFSPYRSTKKMLNYLGQSTGLNQAYMLIGCSYFYLGNESLVVGELSVYMWKFSIIAHDRYLKKKWTKETGERGEHVEKGVKGKEKQAQSNVLILCSLWA